MEVEPVTPAELIRLAWVVARLCSSETRYKYQESSRKPSFIIADALRLLGRVDKQGRWRNEEHSILMAWMYDHD